MKPVHQPSDTGVVKKIHGRLANIERRLGRGGSGHVTHSYIVSGPFSIDTFFSPAVVEVPSGIAKTLLSWGYLIDTGAVTVDLAVNGSAGLTLPLELADGDQIAPYLTAASGSEDMTVYYSIETVTA